MVLFSNILFISNFFIFFEIQIVNDLLTIVDLSVMSTSRQRNRLYAHAATENHYFVSALYSPSINPK